MKTFNKHIQESYYKPHNKQNKEKKVWPSSFERNAVLMKLVKKHDDPLKFLLAVVSAMSAGRLKLPIIGAGSTREVAALWNDHKNKKINPALVEEYLTKKVEGDTMIQEDNTAAIAKQVKQAVKKHVKGRLTVRSKGGKTRFIMVAGEHIDNELRKKVLAVVAPNANVRDKNNISYGNISDRIISATVEQWAKVLGLREERRMKSFNEYIRESVDYVPVGKDNNIKVHNVSSSNHLRNLVKKSEYGHVRTLHYTSPKGHPKTIAWDGGHSEHDKIIHHHHEIGPKAAPDTHVRGNVSMDEVNNKKMLGQFSHHGEQEDGKHTPPTHPHVATLFSKHHNTRRDGLANAWGHTTNTMMSHEEE